MNSNEILDIGNEIIEEITIDAVAAFKRAIETNKLVFTTELLESFKYHIVRTGETLYSEIEFANYGRFKDMKQLRFQAHHPPIEAMEFFVEKTGLDKFAWVPGYDQMDSVPTEIAARRIANAIAFHYNRVPSIQRGYRGTWYAGNVMRMVNAARNQLRWRASEWIALKVKESIEG